MTIGIYDKWSKLDGGQPRVDDTAHGLTSAQINQMHERFNKFLPGIVNAGDARSRIQSMFESDLPKGANWAEHTAQMSTSTSTPRQLNTIQTPYQPEFSSPDRQNYPVHRILANRYWRLFYKLDPVIGNCMDLYSELPWSNFELTGDGIEGEIRQSYEYMCRETQILALLPHFVREYLVLGEVVPHAYFDDSKGVFTYVALHNPDQLEVIDAPFIKMDPILEFIPDDRLRSVLTSDQPALQSLKRRMPPEILQKLYSKQNISLSPVNTTFIARKMHPYDTRGTSILSRMWRILMYEDAVFNASIQIARRNAAPLKVAKLGNASTGWIPPPEQEKRLIELLAAAEADPAAWLVYHYGISFETIGVNERAMSISREWDIIERIKLVAMGISKSFVTGEVTYASSATGLQVFLQRLKSMRLMFEQKWLYPKFLKPIAEINGWVKPKPTEVSHRYRIKRSAAELDEQNAYIIPKIVWDKSLDPQINTELINAMTNLSALGVKFSKTTSMAAVGYSFEEETKKIHREREFEKAYLPKIQTPGASDEAAGGGGGGGGSMPPPNNMPPLGDDGEAPPGADGVKPPGVDAPPTPGGEAAAGDGGVIPSGKKSKSSYDNLKSSIWDDNKYGNWDAEEVSDFVDLLKSGDTKSAFWSQLGMEDVFKGAVASDDPEQIFEAVDEYLQKHGYPDRDIFELREILTAEEILKKAEPQLEKLLDAMPDDVSSDLEFADAVAKIIKDKQSKNSGIIETDHTLIGF